MQDRLDSRVTEPRPLLLCGFGAFPEVPDNPTERVIERLDRSGWTPQGGALSTHVAPVSWSRAYDSLVGAARQASACAVLLTGVAVKATRFRVELRAQNRANGKRPDVDGRTHSGARITRFGPSVARATAPAAGLLRALRDEGLEAETSSDAGDYLCNYALYRLLTEAFDHPSAPQVGFLHVPASATADEAERGMKAAATAFLKALAKPVAVAV